MSSLFVQKLKNQLKRITHPAVRQIRPAPAIPESPISTRWGADRGTPLDRYFIDDFIEKHRNDIKGRVLEIKSPLYTDKFGYGVDKSDVLDIDSSNAQATVIADLSAADSIESNSFDCFLLTETLHYIFSLEDAVAHAHRILRPGGVLLATAPCVSPIDMELKEADCWRFTPNSFQRLISNSFGEENTETTSYGNFYSCTAFLSGLATEEVDTSLLDDVSPMYVQGVCSRAVKRPSFVQ